MAALSESQIQQVTPEVQRLIDEAIRMREEAQRQENRTALRKAIELKNRAQAALELAQALALEEEDIKDIRERFNSLVDELEGILTQLLGLLKDIVERIIGLLRTIGETIACFFPKDEAETAYVPTSPLETQGYVSFALVRDFPNRGSVIVTKDFIPGTPERRLNFVPRAGMFVARIDKVDETHACFTIVQAYGEGSSVEIARGVSTGVSRQMLDPRYPSIGSINLMTGEVHFRYHSIIENDLWHGRSAVRATAEGTGQLCKNPPMLRVVTRGVDFASAVPLMDALREARVGPGV